MAGAGQKNTIDLQWRIDAICNVRLCIGERNYARARTMGINGKAMRRTMGTMKNTMEGLTSGCSPENGS
jgi:hypothetical protein